MEETMKTTIELINQTDYANIYGIYDKSGHPIGTIEVRIAGRDVGTYAYTMTYKYTKRDIMRFWKERKLA